MAVENSAIIQVETIITATVYLRSTGKPSHSDPLTTSEVGTAVIPILQMKRLSLREVS